MEKSKDTKIEGTTLQSGQPDAGKTTNNGQSGKNKKEKPADKEKKEKTQTAMNPLEKIGKKLLAAYPDKNEVFMASDGQGFFNENDALNHAETLTNKKVLPVKK